jgi:hypothetical protein
MSTEPATDVRALADAVRHGELSASSGSTLSRRCTTSPRRSGWHRGLRRLPNQRHGWGLGYLQGYWQPITRAKLLEGGALAVGHAEGSRPG